MTDSEARAVIAANLRRLRGDRSMRNLGKACGTSAGAIQSIERGERAPGVGLLSRLAKALGVSVEELLEENPAARY